jgi:archaellin
MYANVTDDKLDGIMFNVRIPLGGDAVDMSTTSFIFASSKHPTPRVLQNMRNETMTNRGTGFTYATSADYTIMSYYPTSSTSVLTSGEFATFMLNIGVTDPLEAKDWFTLEMRPRIGAATLISKTLGSGVKGGEVL